MGFLNKETERNKKLVSLLVLLSQRKKANTMKTTKNCPLLSAGNEDFVRCDTNCAE